MELFKPGDMVEWRFKPFDPEGPYHNGRSHWLYHMPGHIGEEDPIDHELKHFEPPPYEVVRILEVRREFLVSAGHPQIVAIRMFPNVQKLKADPRHPNPDVRHFSGMLFTIAKEAMGLTA